MHFSLIINVVSPLLCDSGLVSDTFLAPTVSFGTFGVSTSCFLRFPQLYVLPTARQLRQFVHP